MQLRRCTGPRVRPREDIVLILALTLILYPELDPLLLACCQHTATDISVAARCRVWILCWDFTHHQRGITRTRSCPCVQQRPQRQRQQASCPGHMPLAWFSPPCKHKVPGALDQEYARGGCTCLYLAVHTQCLLQSNCTCDNGMHNGVLPRF